MIINCQKVSQQPVVQQQQQQTVKLLCDCNLWNSFITTELALTASIVSAYFRLRSQWLLWLKPHLYLLSAGFPYSVPYRWQIVYCYHLLYHHQKCWRINSWNQSRLT